MSAPKDSEATASPRVWHPFLWAVFPSLSLFASNYGWVRPQELALPLGLMGGLAIALWFALWPVFRDRHARGVALSLLWIPFHGYGAVIDALRACAGHSPRLWPVWQLALGAGLLAALVFVMVRFIRRHAWAAWTRPLNCAALLALLLSGITLEYSAVQERRAWNAFSPDSVSPALKNNAEQPDIYLLVCDSYPRADYLKDYFDYDNAPFLDALKTRGFYVAERSLSNYPRTLFSLASLLNFQYLDHEGIPAEWDPFIPKFAAMIQKNALTALMKRQGYEVVSFVPETAFTELRGADRIIRPPGFALTQFQWTLAGMTPVRSLLSRLGTQHEPYHVPFILEQLEQLRPGDRPRFVFAHIMAPHLPHFLNARGELRFPPPPYRQGWGEITTYLNSRLLAIIDGIQQRKPNSVVCILGDHGPCTAWHVTVRGINAAWKGDGNDYLRDTNGILNAFCVPGQPRPEWAHPEISPVNVVRGVLRSQFALDLPPLEDKACFFPPQSTELVEVKDRFDWPEFEAAPMR